MKLTANITLDELCKSQVAERKGIQNNPNPQQIENIKALFTKYKKPIVKSKAEGVNAEKNSASGGGGGNSIPSFDAGLMRDPSKIKTLGIMIL